MNLTYFRPKMRGNVENKNNKIVKIRFVAKTSDIRNLSENITSDVMLKYQKWQHQGGRQRRGQWCPAPHLKSVLPHFTFGPPVATYIQHCFF